MHITPPHHHILHHLNRQIRELGKSRDAQHLKYAKATAELANNQLNLQAEKMNESILMKNAKALRSFQLDTAKAIAKIQSARGHAPANQRAPLAN